MDHDLAELLDLLGSSTTLEDRLALTELVPKEDTCTFTFTIKKINSASASLKEEKSKGDILVSGRLVDSPTAANPGHLRNRSNQKIELFIPKIELTPVAKSGFGRIELFVPQVLLNQSFL